MTVSSHTAVGGKNQYPKNPQHHKKGGPLPCLPRDYIMDNYNYPAGKLYLCIIYNYPALVPR
jgi:hypothetical protein